MLVKIVHPGGRIELHDRPMLASEIMLKNPRFFVTQPNVFHEPWAVVAPDEVLLLGQKYYVVPINTIRKLQRHHFRRWPSSSPSPLRLVHASKNSRSPLPRVCTSQTPKHNQFTLPEVGAGDGMDSMCCYFTNKGTHRRSYNCLKQVDDETDRLNAGTSNMPTKESEKLGSLVENSCFKCLFRGAKTKSREDSEQSTRDGSSGLKELNMKTGNKYEKRQMKDLMVTTLYDHWQRSLQSINEEHSC